MFCKYCGRDIPETSEFCPECGKKLKKESVKNTEERRPAGIVFALMLLALCGSTVVDWGRVLLFGYQLHIGLVIPTVMLVAGLALLGRLIGQKKICTADYRISDLLVLLCVDGGARTAARVGVSAGIQLWDGCRQCVLDHANCYHANDPVPCLLAGAGPDRSGPWPQGKLAAHQKAETGPVGGAGPLLRTGIFICAPTGHVE